MSRKTNEMREEISKKEKRLERKLTEREKKNIERRIERKYRKRNFIKRTFVVLGITSFWVVGAKLLTSGDQTQRNKKEIIKEIEDKSNSETTNFKESIKIDTNTTEQETTDKERQDYVETINDLLDEYNEKYGTDLSNSDITYIKSKPSYLGIDEQGNYIYDSKGITPVKENVNVQGTIYVMINKNDKKIISSIGKLDNREKFETKNIDTKIIIDWDRNEYIESDKKIDFTYGKTPEQIKSIYEAIEGDFKERTEKER